MQKKYLVTITILIIFFSTFVIIIAQEKLVVTTESEIAQHKDMQKYMEIIAADSSMRKQMMNLMIGKCEGNENAMMEMGKTMMQNSEMNNALTKLKGNDTVIESDIMTDKKMKGDGNSKEKMKMETIKTIQKPGYDSN